ncbi:MAG: ribose 5-phosphate isomerase B [Proteobacteria bacterium]|nr:ribose 5-phosphate isomerase B [Pseudomonadota bacterium]
MSRTVAIACDHAGFPLKKALKKAYGGRYKWLDLGTNSTDSCNYADYGHEMAGAIEAGRADRGIIICGTGVGISIAANRHKAVRAALCSNATMARLAREHNDANVLALGARITGVAVALDCIETFMNTEYEDGRHAERVAKLDMGI